MEGKKIYILGAGNMARETYYIYKDLNKNKYICGFIVEDNYPSSKILCGKSVYKTNIITTLVKNAIFICAIGSPKRKKWIEKLELERIKFDKVIHPSVSLWDNVEIGPGCIISKGVVITCDIKIGKHSIININSNVNHDCIIEDFVTIGPGCHIGGNVKIGNGSLLGIGTTIIHGVKIGKNCFIAAGAVVVKDIPDNTLAMGVPAKPVKFISDRDWEGII